MQIAARIPVLAGGMAILLAVIASAAFGPERPLSEQRPNVVLILTDDLGWADLGSYGAVDIRTPNLDKLADEGVRLTDFHSNGVLCSPTRAGLISGRYQQRVGIETAFSHQAVEPDVGLTADGLSLPQLLKNDGYATALVGKWHLGYTTDRSPSAHGFDYFFGLKAGYHDYYTHRDRGGDPDLWENDQPVEIEGYTTDLLTERAISFVEQHVGRPFFIEVAYNAPHWPYQVPDQPSVARDSGRHLSPSDSATSRRSDYVAMVERMDLGVGRILATLERLDLDANTIVIFTNDNGGEWLADSRPFFSRKWTVWEGGIRVPAIVRWPGRIPPGTVSDQVGITMDFSASILSAAGVALPAGATYDGMDLFPILEGRMPETARTLFWRTSAGGLKQKAVRDGEWKLVVDGLHEYVFDLRTDLSERNDLARVRQDVARRLKRLLLDWEADIDSAAATDRP